MKNLVQYIIYNTANYQYEIIADKKGIELEDSFLPVTKRVPRKIYDAIDLVKKNNLRRIPNPLKDIAQRIC